MTLDWICTQGIRLGETITAHCFDTPGHVAATLAVLVACNLGILCLTAIDLAVRRK
jgi:hypothetical protein